MFRKLMAAVLGAMLLSSMALARPLSLNEISESVCRVSAPTQASGEYAKGSGTCVGELGNDYLVLTNAHVVGNSSSVYLEFFKGGYKTQQLPAKVIWRAYRKQTDVDFAVCTVAKSLFGDHPPRVIPLAPEGYHPRPGHYIACVGCPSARWAQGWEGHIDLDNTTRVIFTPPPVGGQSGSGVAVLLQGPNGEWHTRIGAVLTWRIGHSNDDNQAQGGAIPIGTLYAALQNRVTYNTMPTAYTETAEVDLNKINNWNYSMDCACPRCGRNHPPYGLGDSNNGGGWLPFRRPAPQPQPRAPYNPPTPLPTPGINPNPYGIVPPSLGAPWPGTEPKTPDVTITPEIKGMVEEYEKLLKEKERLENQILNAEDKASKAKMTPLPPLVLDGPQETSFFAKIRNRLTGFGGGLLAGLGLGAFALIWKLLRKKIVRTVDNLQDWAQIRVQKKWGREAGQEARDMMEGLEESILGILDHMFENRRAETTLNNVQTRKLLANRITNGETAIMRATKGEVLEAVRKAAREVDDDSSPTTAKDVPARVEQIIKAAHAQ